MERADIMLQGAHLAHDADGLHSAKAQPRPRGLRQHYPKSTGWWAESPLRGDRRPNRGQGGLDAHLVGPKRFGRPSIFLERMRPWLRTLDASQPGDGLTILGEDGALDPAAGAIVDVCRQYDLVLASGHIPIRASLVLSREARKRGVRFVLTHPLSGSVNASPDEQREIAANGGMIEHVFIGCMPMHQRADPRRIVAAIEAVGSEHCIMASDAIKAWNPPAPEVLRMFIASMLALGIKEDDVYLMTHDNPACLLSLHGLS